MRTRIVHEGADELSYEIRGIVDFAEELEKLGVDIIWENIGDPIVKGEEVPAWIKDSVAKEVQDNDSFGYSPTKGVKEARECIAEERKRESGVDLSPDDILFFNGLGDAISIVYTYLHRGARIIGPSPAYPTHSSAEAAHAGSPHITYTLDPHRNWLPDMEDIKNKVVYNPAVAGILIINPDNPTGMVYPRRVLEEVVSIARQYGLFLVADETYARLAYDENAFTPLAELVGDDVLAIVMRGLSKEVPWPGARTGWVEVYNQDADLAFARYVKTLNDAKMLEVCSTTLPQRVLPKLFTDSRYHAHVRKRVKKYENRAKRAYATLGNIPGVIAPRSESSFYYSVVFESLPENGTLPIENDAARVLTEEKVKDVAPDKRFVYYLLASTGICVVPLSGFNTDILGFRMTLLEPDEAVFDTTLKRISDAIIHYHTSA